MLVLVLEQTFDTLDKHLLLPGRPQLRLDRRRERLAPERTERVADQESNPIEHKRQYDRARRFDRLKLDLSLVGLADELVEDAREGFGLVVAVEVDPLELGNQPVQLRNKKKKVRWRSVSVLESEEG